MNSQSTVFKQKFRKYFRRSLLILILLGVASMTGYYFWRTYPVSEGTRTGVLFKISKKGYFFKTYEGQLHLGGSAMMTQQSVWDFSAKDADVYHKMQELEGKTVKCHYRELVNPFPWQGDTHYIVYDAEAMTNN